MADRYTVAIELLNVAESDATDLAQQIWDEHATAYDADNGEFDINISVNGFPVDWVPTS